MLNITKELTALARKLGYTGKAPDTVAKAINAITASVGEGGGSGCDCPKPLILEMSTDAETGTKTILGATAGEIYDAFKAGSTVRILDDLDSLFVLANINTTTKGIVAPVLGLSGSNIVFKAESENDFLSVSQEPNPTPY